MPIDPRSLSSFQKAQIEGDVACVRCGYNLKGLPRGGNCPECGASVASSFGRGRFLFKNLTDAPMSYLKILRLGFFLLATCVVALFASIVLAGWLKGMGASLLVAGIGVVWWAGVYLVTTSEHPPGDLQSKYDRLKWLRRTNRLLQTAWTVAWLCAAAQMLLIARQNTAIANGLVMPGTPSPFAAGIMATGMAAWILQLLGVVSLVPLCIHFAEIGTAAGNDTLATRLGLAAWGIVLFGGYLVVWYTFQGIWLLGAGLAALGIVVSLGMFVFSLIELAVMCGWAVANSYAAIARDQRLLERAQAHEAQTHAKLAMLPPVEFFQKPRAKADEAPIPLEPERPGR